MSVGTPSMIGSGERDPGSPASADLPRRDQRVYQHLPKKIWVGAIILALFVLVALLAPLLAPYDPLEIDPANRLASPSTDHLLGTDELGRDVFSRLVFAFRVDLPIGFLGALLPALLGITLGAVAGFAGGWLDAAIMRVADVVQAFPTYILVIVLVFVLGQGARSILVAFTILAWVVYARLIRTEVVRVRDLDYVHAARLGGVPRGRILRVHVLPNTVGQILVYFPSDVVFATLALAAFSFLGLGVPPPTPEWGAMIAAGQPYLREQWWLATIPGVVIVVLGLGLLLVGEGAEERVRR